MRYLISLIAFFIWPHLAFAGELDLEGIKVGMSVEDVLTTLEAKGYTQDLDDFYHSKKGPTFDELFRIKNGELTQHDAPNSSWASVSFKKKDSKSNRTIESVIVKFIPMPEGTFVKSVSYKYGGRTISDVEKFHEAMIARHGPNKVTEDKYKRKYWSKETYLHKQDIPADTEILRLLSKYSYLLEAPSNLKLEQQQAFDAAFDAEIGVNSTSSNQTTSGAFDIAGIKVGMPTEQVSKILKAKGYLPERLLSKQGFSFEQIISRRRGNAISRHDKATYETLGFKKGDVKRGADPEIVIVDFLPLPGGAQAVKITYKNLDSRLSADKFSHIARNKYGTPKWSNENRSRLKWSNGPIKGAEAGLDSEVLTMNSSNIGKVLILDGPGHMKLKLKDAIEAKDPTPEVSTTF